MKFLRVALAVALAALVVRSAQAAELPKELAPRYDGLVKAFQTCNLKAFTAFFSNDYVSVDPSGKKSNRADFVKEAAGLFKGAKSCTTRVTYTKVAKQGDTFAVDFDLLATIHGKPGGDQVVHEVGTDYWKKIGGQWMQVKTVDKVFDVKQAAKPTAKPRMPARSNH